MKTEKDIRLTRKIQVARRQLLVGLLFMGGALCMGFMLLKPQYQQYQSHLKAQKNQEIETDQPDLLAKIPLLSTQDPTSWQKNVLSRFPSNDTSPDGVTTLIEGNPKSATPAANLPAGIEKIPLTLQATGSFFAIEHLVHDIPQEFPFAVIKSVELKNPDSTATSSNKSPILQGIIHLDLYVRYH